MSSELAVVVRGRHLEISERFREHVTGKFARVSRFGVPLSRVDVEVSRETNPRASDVAFEVEITCIGAGPVIRAEANADDKFAAMDLAFGRLEERLRRAADRRRSRKNTPLREAMNVDHEPVSAAEPEVDGDSDEVFAMGPVLVREKSHRSGQMSVEQALYEMELVGHDFFLFRDQATGRPSVVYRRRGYDYGLIRLVEEVAAVG